MLLLCQDLPKTNSETLCMLEKRIEGENLPFLTESIKAVFRGLVHLDFIPVWYMV
jgi:hypothetical protein